MNKFDKVFESPEYKKHLHAKLIRKGYSQVTAEYVLKTLTDAVADEEKK